MSAKPKSRPAQAPAPAPPRPPILVDYDIEFQHPTLRPGDVIEKSPLRHEGTVVHFVGRMVVVAVIEQLAGDTTMYRTVMVRIHGTV